MDHQNRVNSRAGSGGPASEQETHLQRKERLRKLALETIDLDKDPYFFKNHMGMSECRLCLTLHPNEGSYLTHTQGKKHIANLAMRAATEAKDSQSRLLQQKPKVQLKKFVKIGRPGYRVTKQRCPNTGQQSLLFQVEYSEIRQDALPRHRFMSAFEQRIETPDKDWQYLVLAAEPYETIAFKIPSREIDRDIQNYWTHWSPETRTFYLQFAFKN
ncbi:MAG: Splicing factor 3A subunit 2 [Paramarteilia canceri]